MEANPVHTQGTRQQAGFVEIPVNSGSEIGLSHHAAEDPATGCGERRVHIKESAIEQEFIARLGELKYTSLADTDA